MYLTISLLMITKNSQELLEKSLRSAGGLVDEIVVVDGGSTDNTTNILASFKAIVYNKQDVDLGVLRAYGLSKCKGEWVLMLDTDEVISSNLKSEILNLHLKTQNYNGFYIPYQNHFLGHPIYYGGEDYKILRLFKKSSGNIADNVIHEHVKVEGNVGELKGKIFHYSYRTLGQTYRKFTDYARREAARKTLNGEKTNLWKLILYPLHMFWSRYIKDHGYKDHYLRIFLDLGFAYMEWLTYFLMFFKQENPEKNQSVNPVKQAE